jgi:hypothetical protein
LDGITVFATSLPSQGPAAPDAAGAPEAAGLEDAVEADGLEVELVDEQPVSANAVQAARIPNERRLSTAFPSLTAGRTGWIGAATLVHACRPAAAT